jgi:hypothetical protein
MKKLTSRVGILMVCLGACGAMAQTQSSSLNSSEYVNNTNKVDQVGVGLKVGTSPGVDFEYWSENNRALDGTIGFNNGNSEFSLAYLWMFRNAFANLANQREASYFVPFIGLGALAGFGTNGDYFNRNTQTSAVALQVPLGIEFLPSKQRFSVFAELAPSLEVSPVGYFFTTADLGARFYF